MKGDKRAISMIKTTPSNAQVVEKQLSYGYRKQKQHQERIKTLRAESTPIPVVIEYTVSSWSYF